MSAARPRKRIEVRQCLVCSEAFDPGPRRNRRYCEEHRKGIYSRACEECDVMFVGATKTCSDKCSRARKRRLFHESWRSVREKNPVVTKECACCGAKFSSNYYSMKRRYCSRKCGEKAHRSSNSARQVRRISNTKRRARLRGVKLEEVRPIDVFERDNWRCGICRKRIGKKTRYPNPRCATVDHVIPLDSGGEHSMRNVRAAHFACNSTRGVQPIDGGDQLRLIA
jgi:5-methylcytosine-specific restriction endonuclease McrA